MRGHRKVWVAAATALTFMAAATSAQAQRPASLGEGAPVGQSGIQLYNFSTYLSNGAGEIPCPLRPRRRRRTASADSADDDDGADGARVRVPAVGGIKNVELYGYPGNPFPSGRSRTATRRRRSSCARSVTSTGSASRAVTAASTRPLGRGDRDLADPRPGPHRRVRAGRRRWRRQPTRRRCDRGAAQQARQAVGRGGPRPSLLPQPRGRVRRDAAVHGQRRAQERRGRS